MGAEKCNRQQSCLLVQPFLANVLGQLSEAQMSNGQGIAPHQRSLQEGRPIVPHVKGLAVNLRRYRKVAGAHAPKENPWQRRVLNYIGFCTPEAARPAVLRRHAFTFVCVYKADFQHLWKVTTPLLE